MEDYTSISTNGEGSTIGTALLVTGISAVVGAITGYLVTDLLVYEYEKYRFKQAIKNLDELEPEYDQPPAPYFEKGYNTLLDGMPEDVVKKIDYSGYSEKGSLEELAKPYLQETGPAIVSYDEWEDNPGDFNRVVVAYYTEDMVFSVHDDEDVVMDSQDVFGPNVHLHFGEISGDDDVVYVVNPSLGSIFEINRVHGSYAVEVKGEEPEPEKPPRAAPKRHARRAAVQKKEEQEEDGSS